MRGLVVVSLIILSACSAPRLTSTGLATGEAPGYCEKHHRPLVRQHVFRLPGERQPTIDLIGDAQRLTEENPHALYPFASVHHSKEFPQPAVLWYCPDCERAVLMGLARIETRER